MRLMPILLAVAGFPLFWQPLWGDAPSVRKDITKSTKHAAKLTACQAQIGTDATPLIVEAHSRPENEEEAAKARADKEHASLVETWMLIFTGAAAIFTGLLVWVGCRGVRAANRTLEAIKRQADLMQAQFDQWVELENWTTTKPVSGKFVVRVDLVNHTTYPVTLDDGELSITDNIGHALRYYLGKKTFLSPNQPHPIDFDLGIGMLPEQLASLESASFGVKGTFSHHHRITKEETRQPLEGMLRCGPWKSDGKWHAEYTALVHMNPERAEGEGKAEQKENVG